MRFLLAGTLATVTAAGLAAIRLPLLSEDDKTAASEIREGKKVVVKSSEGVHVTVEEVPE